MKGFLLIAYCKHNNECIGTFEIDEIELFYGLLEERYGKGVLDKV
jgi:hypothetical protein